MNFMNLGKNIIEDTMVLTHHNGILVESNDVEAKRQIFETVCEFNNSTNHYIVDYDELYMNISGASYIEDKQTFEIIMERFVHGETKDSFMIITDIRDLTNKERNLVEIFLALENKFNNIIIVCDEINSQYRNFKFDALITPAFEYTEDTVFNYKCKDGNCKFSPVSIEEMTTEYKGEKISLGNNKKNYLKVAGMTLLFSLMAVLEYIVISTVIFKN